MKTPRLKKGTLVKWQFEVRKPRKDLKNQTSKYFAQSSEIPVNYQNSVFLILDTDLPSQETWERNNIKRINCKYFIFSKNGNLFNVHVNDI